MFFTAVLVYVFPCLLSGLILLLYDRNLGTSFYLSDIVVMDRYCPMKGEALFFSTLILVLGHPEVYIILLPAMGCVGNTFRNSRKPSLVIWAMLASLFAIAILSFLVWAHHMFVNRIEPFSVLYLYC